MVEAELWVYMHLPRFLWIDEKTLHHWDKNVIQSGYYEHIGCFEGWL